MARPPELGAEGPLPGPVAPERDLDWSRLIRAETAGEALEQIANWLGPRAQRLTLVCSSSDEPPAVWARGRIDAPSSRSMRRLPSDPDCSIELDWSGSPPGPEPVEGGLIDQAARALDAWRQARVELERANQRLAARTPPAA